ncbi:MAG TPA: L-threonylcarbamoyladenylate synthase [Gammaproteobacteria bacterium]|nr:L-threonylcarbamoyladenylate synthase [Gammaproteobacteria bacterium]
MSQFFRIHPENPQARLLARAVEIIRDGGVIVYPTDSCYALGCHIGDKGALDRIRTIRRFDSRHNFTLVCRDLSEVAAYGRLENQAFRLIKALTPGPYTFILPATREVPRRVQHARRKTIGVRVPDHQVTQSLLETLGEPLVSCTLQLPGEELPMTDAEDIRARLEHHVDLVIDGGNCGLEATTVVDLSDGPPQILRQGKGEAGVLFA